MNDIKTLFPYASDAKLVTEDMCDINGHMNVAYYLQAFDESSRNLFEEIGFDEDYLQMGYSCFAIEDSLRYMHEFLEGEDVISMFRIHDFNKKLIHIVGVLMNNDRKLSAISETLVVHVDMKSRKASNMPETLLDRVKSVYEQHTRYPINDFDIRLKINK